MLNRDNNGCVLTGRGELECDACHIVPWTYFQKHDLIGKKIFDVVFPYSCDNPEHRVMDVRNGILMWHVFHGPFDQFDFTFIKIGDTYTVKTLEEHEFEKANTNALKELQKQILALNGKQIFFNPERQSEWPGEKFLRFHNECFELKREQWLKAQAEAQEFDEDFDQGMTDEYCSTVKVANWMESFPGTIV